MEAIEGKREGKLEGKRRRERSVLRLRHQQFLFWNIFALNLPSSFKGTIHYLPPPRRHPDCRYCSSDCISVSDIYLVDSANNVRLFPIQRGESLDFGFLEATYGTTEFSVECIAEGQVGSMLITDNFGSRMVDNEQPFVLAGDFFGDFFDSNFQENPGSWTVTCQPFCADNARGQSGPSTSTSFDVVVPGPECNECRAGCINVVDFVLVDAATNRRVRSIVPGGEFGPEVTNGIEMFDELICALS